MQQGLTVEVHPNINPLTPEEWQRHFPGKTEPKVIAQISDQASEYICIVVNCADIPILLVPIQLKEVRDLGLIESVVSDASGLLMHCGNLLSEWYTSIFFGRRVTDLFQNSYVVTSPSVVPGSAVNKEALDQAFRVYSSLSKTMPVALMNIHEHNVATVKVAAVKNLI